jgi:membrane-bound lytic murein transglycosylase D
VRHHTVEAGETLSQIARRNDLSVAQLSAANRLDPGEALQPGQRLRIPLSGEAQRSAERPRRTTRNAVRRHVVKDGESLWSIARSYDTTVAALGEANQLSASAVLQPGQTLRIPARARDER